MKKLFSVILVLGLILILGFGNIAFANELQESKEIIKVPGASEDFTTDGVSDYLKNLSAEQKEMVRFFACMTVGFFHHLAHEQIKDIYRIRTGGPYAIGVNSKKLAVIYKFEAILTNGRVIKLSQAYYVDDLQVAVERSEEFIRWYCSLPSYECKDKGILLMVKAKEAAQKFVDSIKEKISKK